MVNSYLKFRENIETWLWKNDIKLQDWQIGLRKSFINTKSDTFKYTVEWVEKELFSHTFCVLFF
jgi:CCR4-NOT transcriptional regulation complex NOT5 subunit